MAYSRNSVVGSVCVAKARRRFGPGEERELAETIAADGGEILASYRDPLGGHLTLLAGLPIDKVEPTPFQRAPSATHAKRLGEVIDKLDRFLDPIIVVRADSGTYLTPNGNHRLSAMKALGAKAIVALVVRQFAVAYKLLALNTEKAHKLREKALEVIRMARSLAEHDPRPTTRAGVRARVRGAIARHARRVLRAAPAVLRRCVQPGAAQGRRVLGGPAAAGARDADRARDASARARRCGERCDRALQGAWAR